MGIPSFYKHLIQTISGLTSKSRAPPAVFALDLNCAIYHCVKKVQKLTPYTHENHAKWEADLIKHVIGYIKQLVRYVEPSEKVYIAVDGVAPMAKIKQQRMRRFKSAATAEIEARLRAEARGEIYVPAARWDSNAITPGTRFMANLATALRAYSKTSPSKIIVSPADEPGEGEQKIMAWARAHAPSSMVVYGLDADLIILALWACANSSIQVDLYREEVEFNGAIKVDSTDAEQYLYLNTNVLAQTLYAAHGRAHQSQNDFIRDFVGLMSILGNDFVPHGMAHKIKDDGINKLCEIKLTTPLVVNNAGHWHYDVCALRQVFNALAAEEQHGILRNVKKKLESRVGSTASKNPEDRALAIYNDTPVKIAADSVLLKGRSGEQVLTSNWADVYDNMALGGVAANHACELYLKMLSWTLAYYSGATIDDHAYYPWFLPPRHASILETLASKTALTPPNTARTPLKCLEQLSMVLPESSFHLLPAEYKKLITYYPVYWPQSYGIYSFGRRFMWECEPLIPLIQPSAIKEMIETVLEDD